MAKYNKSWGSVSTHFSKTTAPSSAQRMSKAAEDKYQKEMNQLRTMKDVAAFESRQAQTSASMASKAAEYELGALRKFSGKLDTFLNTTGKDMYAKAQAEDLQKHIDKYESSDLKDHEEWNKKQTELENKIAGISENNAKRAELQEQLRKHNLTSPNDIDPAGLSGNEKLAYLTVKSKDTLANVGVNYDAWINDPNAELVEADWRPKIPVINKETGATTYEYEKIPRASVNHPDGKKKLKQLFFKKTMEENPMGGLKNEWKTLILAGPLRKQLSGIQAKETQQYNKDQARIQDEASDQASFNFIGEVEGYTHTPDPNISKAENDANALKNRQALLSGVLQSKRFNYTKHSGGTYRTGVEKWFDKALQQVTELTDGDKIEDAHGQLKLLLYKTPIADGPNKGKTMAEAFPDIIDELDVSKKVNDATRTRHDRLRKQQKDEVTSSRLTIQNQIKSDIESAGPEGTPKWEAAVNKGKETLSKWQREMMDKYPDGEVRAAIFAQAEDPEFAKYSNNEADWRAKVDDLHKQYSGVIPLKEVGFMPNSIREKLENEGHRFVRTIPGAENERQTGATKQTMIMLKKELRQSEVDSGQRKTNGDSAVMDDLTNDIYHKLLQGYMIDDKMQWTDAASRAEEVVLDLIRAGRNHDPNKSEVIEGEGHPMKGQKNPFIVKPGKDGSAWTNSSAMRKHRTNRQRLLTYPEAQYRHADREYAAISRERKVDVNSDYLFTPIQFDKTKSAGDEGYIMLDSIQHLGLTDASSPGMIMQYQANRLGIENVGSVAEFRKAQRNALIKQTGGVNSPIWADPVLIKAWDLPKREEWEEATEKAARAKRLKTALANPWYNIYSVGGLL